MHDESHDAVAICGEDISRLAFVSVDVARLTKPMRADSSRETYSAAITTTIVSTRAPTRMRARMVSAAAENASTSYSLTEHRAGQAVPCVRASRGAVGRQAPFDARAL